MIDFFIRIFVNPKYSPSLILGRFVVNNQEPEYVGAPQKKFAWAGGFVLGLLMFFIAVVNNIVGPVNLLICITCLLLLFFETSFGICLGCKMYNKFNKDKAQLCPGGTCALDKRVAIQKINLTQVLMVVVFLLVIGGIGYSGLMNKSKKVEPAYDSSVNAQNKFITNPADCVIPEWVKKIGHEEKYKEHHGCEE